MEIIKKGIQWTSTKRRVANKKLVWIQAIEEFAHKCHTICVLSASQYELNTKHFLTLLSTVLVKAFSVYGLLWLLVIQGEPPALLCSAEADYDLHREVQLPSN